MALSNLNDLHDLREAIALVESTQRDFRSRTYDISNLTLKHPENVFVVKPFGVPASEASSKPPTVSSLSDAINLASRQVGCVFCEIWVGI